MEGQMRPHILTLDSDTATLGIVGGKGANLAELTRSGFAVPRGFVVTTSAYREFISANDIAAQVIRLAERATPGDQVALEEVSREIRALFLQGQMPYEVSNAIVSAYAELSASAVGEIDTEATARASALSRWQNVVPPMAVAVRSSATAEDLPDLSFAGQQDTYLNVIGGEALCDAVKSCWSSLWTSRALGYRAHHQINHDDLALAVVVQQMIFSESSGVLFTANPLTGCRHEMVIDASLGLGEAVVAGKVEPDRYSIDSDKWQVTSIQLGAKAVSIRAQSGGGTVESPEDNAQRQALSEEEILTLAQLGQRVADHFGAPQDIEWATANGQLHLLQARPITSLYPLPPEARREDLRVYINFNTIQGMMEPVTPLGCSVFRLAVCLICRPSDIPYMGGRLFVDITALVRDPRLRKPLLGALSRVDPDSRQALVRLIDEGRFAPKIPSTPQPRGRRSIARTLKGLLGVLKTVYKARHIAWRALTALLLPERARAAACVASEAFLDEVKIHARDSSDLSTALAALEMDVKNFPVRLTAQILPGILVSMLIMSIVERWLLKWLNLAPGTGLQLTRGLSGNVTTEMNLKLWALAQTVRSDPQAHKMLLTATAQQVADAYVQRTLPATIQQAFEAFFDEYGMRGVAEIDIGRPRWRETPAFIVQLLQNYLHLEDLDAAPDVIFQRAADEGKRLRTECVASLRRQRFGAVRAGLLSGALRRLEVLSGMRELPRSYFAMILGFYRPLLLDHGQQLVATGALSAAEDIFFVLVEDLKRFAHGEPVALSEVAAANRDANKREQGRRQVPRMVLSTGETFFEGLCNDDPADFMGSGVSPGIAEGPARVVLSPEGVRLEPGEILVCRSTDPGWTPLFLAAAGLVMETGGLVTHGSVVARECGIPAVVGVRQATERLRTGQRLRIDGSAGRVTVLE